MEDRQLARKRNSQPANPTHPGEMILEEFLRPAGTSQGSFARQVGWTKARLNELIKGKRGITAEAALDLAEALGTSPRLWMNLQGDLRSKRGSEEATGRLRRALTGAGQHPCPRPPGR